MTTKEEMLTNNGEARDYDRRLIVTPLSDAYIAMEKYARQKAFELYSEMKRYLPVIEALESDPGAWQKFTKGTGIATANGYKNALDQLIPGTTKNQK